MGTIVGLVPNHSIWIYFGVPNASGGELVLMYGVIIANQAMYYIWAH